MKKKSSDKSPPPPDQLSDAAKAVWARAIAILAPAKILDNADLDNLGVYCAAVARWAEAEESLKRDGIIIRAPSGYPVQSPWLSVSNKAAEQIRRFGDAFGFTPASRAKLLNSDLVEGDAANETEQE